MSVRQYIGARYVIKIYENSVDPASAEWESSTNYEPLTMVTYNYGSYLSKKEVPASVGNPADNPSYWVQTGFYNGQIANLQNQIDEINNTKLPDIDDAIQAVIDTIGSLSDLHTEDQTSIVAAINELVDTPHASVQDWSNEYVLFLGDSYLTRQNAQSKTIVDLICSNLGITNYTNAATGGASFAGGQIADQITNADASIPYTQCVILAGINDARFSNVIGSSPIPNYNVFKAALGNAITNLRTKFPQFKSIYLGYIGSRTVDATDGQGNFESIAASTYGYMYDGMRIGYTYLNGVENIMHRNLENYETDGLHPSNQGIADIANGVSNALITGSVETKLPLHDLLIGSTAVNNASAGTGNNFRVVMSNDHFNFTIREGGVTNLTTAHSATQGSDLQLYSDLYDKFETDIYLPVFVDVVDNGSTTHEKALIHLNNRDMFIIFLDASHTAISKITTHFATADYPYTYIN